MKARSNTGFLRTTRSKFSIVFITILGVVVVWYTISDTRQKMRKHLLQKAQIAASSLNIERIKTLEGKSADIEKGNYQRLKNQLRSVRMMYPDCRFLYLMRKNEKGQVIFLIDAQKPTSPDYAEPGLIYREVSDEYLEVFRTGKRSTVGPITDRWGKLMTSLIPVKNPETGKLLAVMGMDVTIKDWNIIVLKRLLPLIVIVLVAVLLVFYVQQVRLLKKDKAARYEIRRSQQLYKALFDHAADGILTGTLKGEITKVNRSFCDITGYEEEDIIGRKVDFLFSRAVLEQKPLLLDKISAGATVKQEREMMRKDGELIVVEMHSKRVDEYTLQSFYRDITRRKRNEKLIKLKNEELMAAEEELRTSNDELRSINSILEEQKEELAKAKKEAEESDRLKSNFLANMSHEIRTPMNAIIGFSELILESEELKDSEAESYLETVMKQGTHLLQLINDIVDLSKIEANQIRINRKKVCVNEIIDDLYAAFRMHRLNTENVEILLEKALTDEQSWIMTDELRLKQIFNNLISNALKFTRQGVVRFGYRFKEQGKLHFFVSDTGIGIPRDKQEQVFERFHRLHDGHTSHYEGTGLGLSISKSLADLLGGDIFVESELGKGSVFVFTLPLE